MLQSTASSILIVDDEPYVAELLCRHLTSEGYSCTKAPNGEKAVELLEREGHYHLVITDILMPVMSGIDLLTYVRSRFPYTAVLMVTAVDDRSSISAALEIGAYGYLLKPFDRSEILINVTAALERRRINIVNQEYEAELEMRVQQRTVEVRQREEEIILRLLSASKHRDDETGSHVRRVGLYAAEMARLLGHRDEFVDSIRLAAPMHDVGKIGIPDSILLKNGSLTHEEFEIMKRHSDIGAGILEGSAVPMLQMAREIALCHHEHCDGSGYPRGLKKDAIPEAALIVSIVDYYDALVHDRVYRQAFPEKEALSIMRQRGGGYFGEEIFDCFVRALPSLRHIREENQEVKDEHEPCGHETILQRDRFVSVHQYRAS